MIDKRSLWKKYLLYDPILLLVGLFVGSQLYHYSPLYHPVTTAVAVVYPTKGNRVSGAITFIQEDDGVRVIADCKNLKPGKHGFHIHELGNCNCDDGKCTGGHFNPTDKPHGGPHNEERHVGDFGNIEADKDGNGYLEFIDKDICLNGQNSIIGRSVIIHADEDDLVSQPTGNAGARIGCGVIGIAKKD